jgi:hypothetical protein
MESQAGHHEGEEKDEAVDADEEGEGQESQVPHGGEAYQNSLVLVARFMGRERFQVQMQQ